MLCSGHYTDIHSLLGGRVGGVREVQLIINDDGHHSDVDINRVAAASGDGDQSATGAGGVDQAARSRDYDGLDPSVLATLRQPQRPQEYAGLANGETATTTQQITEVNEMYFPPI